MSERLKPMMTRFIFCLVLLAGFVSTTLAQSTSSVLNGRVTDASGAVIGGAEILVKDTATGRVRTAVSDPEGKFEVANLSPGTFLLTVFAPGFAPFEQTAQVAQTPLSIEVVLKTGNVFETTTVTADESGYQPLSATTGTRTDTALRDVPQSIQVVTRQLIEDQGAVGVQDVVRNVSGVNVPHSVGSRQEAFTIRGFTSITNVYRDGYRNDFGSNRSATELSNIERVEVLKGPASVLFGRLDPSGVVNLVTRKPLADHRYSIQLQLGSFAFVRPTFDFTGPLNRSKTVSYRLIGTYDRSDTFRDFNQRERHFIAPSVLWLIRPTTSLLFEGEYQKTSNLIDRGLPAVGNGPAPVPLSRYFGDPAIPYKNRQGKFGMTFNHAFNDRITLRSALRTSAAAADYDSRQPRALRADGRTLELGLDFQDQRFLTHYFQNDLVMKFDTGSIRHTGLIGVDASYEVLDLYQLEGATRQTIDNYNPTYNFATPTIRLRGDNTRVNKSFGFFLQDQISLRDNFKVTAGIRFDDYTARSRDFLRPAGSQITRIVNRKFTPRVGVVYQPVQAVSLFFNYSRSFQPQLAFTFANEPFVPETGEQFEAGVKFGYLNNRLTSTIAVFQITKQNVSSPDPVNNGFNIQVGEQRSRGVEFDLSARVTPNWNILMSFSLTQSVVSRDTRFTVGNQLLGIPRPMGSFWTTYELDERLFGKALKGVGFGGGVFGVGRRFGDNAHTFQLPMYVRADLTAYYKLFRGDRLKARFAVNVNNLFDRRYFEGVQTALSILPGAPRNVSGSIQYFF